MTLQEKVYWMDIEPTDGEEFIELNEDPRHEQKNNLAWGYKWVSIPHNAVNVFGARAIVEGRSIDILHDRKDVIGQSGTDRVDNFYRWLNLKLNAVQWRQTQRDDLYYRISSENADGTTHRLFFWCGISGYAYITAWLERDI